MTRWLPVVLVLASLPLQAQTPAPVRVYITSVGAVDGRTDPNKDNQDSVADLQHAIGGHKAVMRLAETADDADIILIVQDREKAQMTAHWAGTVRDCTVRVLFRYQGRESPMSASAAAGTATTGGAWKKAAGKLITQLDTWIKTNLKRAP